ncbi:DegV family protein [Paenibacillus flagellatus]|uniref:DegV family protein n=1 Tax=Paenibacillus flagellatus TaxID=2211139 RepID=A0A2V5KS26_9BACL|nr:DegV family protein [Paenibacillus flagellatus]PYI54337.1 DegV family protein [Paenibacillus flagellatus]
MANVRIVTDSTSDIPEAVRKQYGIEMVPLKVHFGTETFYDAVTIQANEFYDKLKSASAMPTTSQPSPVDFLEAYKRAADEPDTSVVSIHLSSAVSGTYQSAVLAKSLLEDKGDVSVVDSKSASYGIGLLVVEAAKAAREGKSKEQILELVAKLRRETRIYFLVGTLEYLQKGGRIGKAAALFGSLLNIKPILTIDDDGEVASVDKVRGHKKAMGRIVEMLKEEFGDRELHMTVAHGQAEEAANEFAALLREQFNITQMTYAEVGPVVGAHTGPGVLAVFVVPAS